MSSDGADQPSPWAPLDATPAATPSPPPPPTPTPTPTPPAYLAAQEPVPVQWGPPVETPLYLQRPGAAETKARNRRALAYALLALVIAIGLVVVVFAFLFRNGATPEDFGGL